MNYGQVVSQIRDLGFADDNEIEEFDAIVPNAINRAITEISLNYAPIISYIDIVQNYDDKDALYEYEMPDNFMKFADVPVKRQMSEGIYQRFNDFDIESENTIIMSGNYTGTYRVFYVADHEPFTIKSSKGSEIPLPLKAHHLVPLLASYYVWLDDDQAKAEMYYQRYQTELQNAKMEAEKPRMKLRTDWGGFVG